MARVHKKVEVRIDEDRIFDALTINRMIAAADIMTAFVEMQRNGANNLQALAGLGDNLRELRGFVAEFIWNGSEYLPPEEGKKVAGTLNFKQLMDAVVTIQNTAEDAAVPEGLSGISD